MNKSENNICNKCGKELKTKIRGRVSILYCEEHGDVLVSTYWNEYERDHTKYDIILLPNNECNANNIKLIAKITNSNVVNAKKILISNKNELIYSNYTSTIGPVNAVKIKDIAIKLNNAKMNFKIVPEFNHKIK